MKIQKIMNISELKIFEELKDFIYKSDLNIFPQINMKQVITSSQLELSTKERKTFEKSIFDFVITDNEYAPIFAIEFDGPDHYKYEKTIYSDFRKMSICKKASFPLLRIKYDIYDKFSKITIIKYIINRYINWKNEKSELEQDFRNKTNELRTEGLSDSEIYDYLMVEEPEMEFNFKYYLPEIKNMQKNIYDEFGLLPHYLFDDITHNKISKYVL